MTHVDAEVARVRDRRARDPEVDLGRAGLADQPHEGAGGGAPDQRVVDHHDPFAGEVLGQRVELHGDATITHLLRRLDEGPPDVAVLDQPVVEREPAAAGEADGRRDRRVGDGHDDVGVGRPLVGELLAEPLSDLMDAAVVPGGVGAAEVHELERASSLLRGRCQHLTAVQLCPLERDDLARRDFADVDAPEGLERARLGSDGVPTGRQAADRQRPEAPRVADGDDPVGGEQDERVGALPRRQGALHAVLPRAPAGGGEHQREHLGVARGGEPEAAGE